MDVFGGFELENRQPAIGRASEKVDQAAIAGGKRKNLAMHRRGMERGVDFRQIRADRGFKPALWKPLVDGRAELG